MVAPAVFITMWLLTLPARARTIQRSATPNESSPSNVTLGVNHKLYPRVRVGGGSGAGGTAGIEDLFLVDAESRCDGHMATLNAWVQEAATLHTAVEHAYHHAAGWQPYMLHWEAYFGVRWDYDKKELSDQNEEVNGKIWEDVQDHIDRVTQFLAGGGLKNPQDPGTKPRLFCSEDAFEVQDDSRALRDKDGKDIATAHDGTTGLPTEYLTVDEAFARQRDQGANVYWVPAFKGYDISKRRSMCPPPENGRVFLARTARATSSGAYHYYNKDGFRVEYNLGKANRHMILCPDAFTTTASHSVDSLSETIGSLYPSQPGRGDLSKSIDKMLTRGSTFYHELYHLTDNDHTLGSKNDDEYTRLSQLYHALREDNSRLSNAHNPETYVFLAQALHMYRNKPSDKARVMYVSSFPDDARGWGHDDQKWAEVSARP